METRDVLSRQLETQSELDPKAADSIKFNTLAFGIILSALSIASRTGPTGETLDGWIAAGLVSGLALLGGSVVVGVFAYRSTKLGAGLQAEGVRDALEQGSTERAILEGMVRTYTEILEGNRRKLDATARLVNVSMCLLVAGLALLATSMAGSISLAT